MYTNLRNTLFREKITIKQYAEFLGVQEKTVQNKLKGITDFTYPEFKKTCTLLLPKYNADFLFASDTQQPAWKEVGGMDLEELEKRIAALEVRFENGKELLEEVVGTLHDALERFVTEIHTHTPKIEEIIEKIKQKE